MSNQAVFKQILEYIDQLYCDLGQLAVFAEAAMGERGWVSLPSARDRVCWHTSHTLQRAQGWRLPYLCRFYTLRDSAKVEHSAFYLASLDADTAFEFPTLLCGRAAHQMLTESEIYSQIFHTHRLRPLLRRRSPWRLACQDTGWVRAEPAFRTAVDHLQVYILNLFDMGTKQHVIDNIVRPLTEDAAFSDLQSTLTIESYLPAELAESIQEISSSDRRQTQGLA